MKKMRMIRIMGGFFCACLLFLSQAAAPPSAAPSRSAGSVEQCVEAEPSVAPSRSAGSVDVEQCMEAEPSAAPGPPDGSAETELSGTQPPPAESAPPAAQPPGTPELSLYASAAVLMDADSGRVLYGRNQDAVMAMASTTKIMTCILVLEHASQDDVLTVSAYAASMPKVKLYIQRGEQYTVGNLLRSLMLESHNDSAVALAEYVGKQYLTPELREKDTAEYTVEESRQALAAFAALMNRKAAWLGCENTWFITPNGLDATEILLQKDGSTVQKEHCTTAAELARIMSYCVKESPQSEAFLEVTRTRDYSFYANGRDFSCTNHNAFLDMMEGALTGKTGFTNKAGYCYVGALERDGRTFVVALLACGWPDHKTYKWSDTRKLMQYGIDNYFYRSFSEEGVAFDDSQLTAIPVENGQTDTLGDTAYVQLRLVRAGAGGRSGEGQGTGSQSGEGRDAGGRSSEGQGTGGRSGAGQDAGGQSGAGQDAGGQSGGRSPGQDETGAQQAVFPQREGILLRQGEEIKVVKRLKENLTAPVEAGEEVGCVEYMVGDTVYRRESVVTADAVGAVDLEWCAKEVLERFFSLW